MKVSVSGIVKNVRSECGSRFHPINIANINISGNRPEPKVVDSKRKRNLIRLPSLLRQIKRNSGMINCQPCLMIQSFHKFYLCMLIYLNVKSHLHVSLSYLGIFPDLTYRMMFTRTAKKELFVRIYYTINFPLLLFLFLHNVFV